MEARTLAELINEDDPGWPFVLEWIKGAKNHVEVLPSVEEERGADLLRVQVTTRSPMGAIVYETGGMLVDHGWVRVLGSGHPRLPRALGEWNRTMLGSVGGSGVIAVADDVLGGSFVVNGGGLEGPPGNVVYFGPEVAEPEDLGAGYSHFLVWLFSGDLADFYAGSRFPGWEEEVQQLAGDAGIAVFPPMCTQGPPIGERHRAAVPLTEMVSLPVS